MMRRLIPWTTLAWASGFVYLGLATRVPEPGAITITETAEALGHLVGTLGLTMLAATWVDQARSLPARRAVIVAGSAALVLALVIEVAQVALPGRSAQAIDVVLDIVGVVLGGLIYLWLARRQRSAGRTATSVVAITLAVAGVAAVTLVTGTSSGEGSRPVCAERPAAEFPEAGAAGSGDRVGEGLVAEYRFDEGAGDTAHDRVNIAPAVDLTLDRGVDWLADGPGVSLAGRSGVAENEAPSKIVDSATASNQFTAEAWVAPSGVNSGPARILSISEGIALRQINFQIGQQGTCLNVRVRRDQGADADVQVIEGVFTRRALRHIVVTLEQDRLKSYVNGVLVDDDAPGGSGAASWERGYGFYVGNGADRDRPFEGEVYLVAIYDRALSPAEVAQNFAASERPGP